MSDQVALWNAGTYSLKHAHEWLSTQPGILFNYALPRLAIGWTGSISGPRSISGPVPIDRVGIVAAAAALLVLGLLYKHFRLQKGLLSRPEIVFILPFLLIVLALFPSWRLFGPTSYRYMVPFLPGLCLSMVIALQAIPTRPGLLFGLVGAYALYSGYDILSKRSYVPPDKDCLVIAARLSEEKIDGALVSGKCTEELAWRAGGRFWVADTNYRSGDHTLYPRRSRIAAADSIATINLDEATLRRFGVNRGAFASAEPVASDLVIYRRKPSLR